MLSVRAIRLAGLSRVARTMSTVPSLPLQPLSANEETNLFKQRVNEMDEFFKHPRFASVKRTYSATDVASKQGSLPVVPLPSSMLANKLHALFSKAAAEGKPIHTMGAIDPVQVTQMARHQEVVYVSGWAASSVLTTGNNEVGPDYGCVSCTVVLPHVR